MAELNEMLVNVGESSGPRLQVSRPAVATMSLTARTQFVAPDLSNLRALRSTRGLAISSAALRRALT
jgi:hypothetical protein